MAVTIKIQFKNVASKIDSAKGKAVVWEIGKSGKAPTDPVVIRKDSVTTTDDASKTTDGEGVLTIKDVDLDDDETLQLKYKIGEQTGKIQIKHSGTSKVSQTLELTQWLSLTLKVTLVDSGTPTKETIKDKDLLRQIQKLDLSGNTIVKPESPARTNAEGIFTEDVEITEQETLQIRFTIDGKTDAFNFKHNDKTKAGEGYEAKRFIKLTENVAAQVARPIVAPVVKADKITNPERHWLTYESLFNKDKFRKPNCEFKLSLYLIPVNDLLIWLRDDVSPEHLQTFVNSFFPDFEAGHIKDLAKVFWSWKSTAEEFWVVRTSEEHSDGFTSNGINVSPKKNAANRGEMKIYLEPYAVLPYNRFDNIDTSNALATKNLDGNLLKIREEPPYLWSAWKTASRSCLVRLPDKAVKEKGILWKTGAADSIARAYEEWKYDKTHREPLFENLRKDSFNLKTLNKTLDFSLKTGVQYIGGNFQGGFKHKDVIGDWLIGCLRSDYINHVDKKLAPPKEDLLILTELITITEKKIRKHPDAAKVAYREGIQVRDVSILDENKIYLAPLNVPFLDLDFKEFKDEFSYFSDKSAATAEEIEAWKKFWKYAFAALLGRAKALTLLRYGLQIVNPNQQNFLIEFEERDGKMKPTGTFVVRDLNDASIHREVVWALFDGEGLPPQDTKGGWKSLSKIKVPVIEFEFTEGRMAKEGFDNVEPQETGTKIEGEQDFGPPGTQFLWQRFSAFSNLNKGTDIQTDPVLSHKTDKNIATEIYKNLLVTMADWGMAHNKSYIGCAEKHFGKNFRDINWARCPNPSRYKNFRTISGGKSDIITKIVKKTASNPRLEIAGFSYDKLSDEDKRTVEEKLKITDEVKLRAEAEIMRRLSEEEKRQLTEEGKRKLIDARIKEKEEIKEMFVTQPCFQIQGRGFTENTKPKLGIDINADLFIITPTKIFVCNQMETSIKAVLEKKSVITANDSGESAIYGFQDDPEYQTEIEWEETSSKVIHDFLASAEGQKALRDCRDRKWTLLKPSFTVQLIGVDKEPFAWKRVFMKNASKKWTDLTNEKGEIDVYKESVDEVINICPQKDESVTEPSVWLECKPAVWEGITIKIV